MLERYWEKEGENEEQVYIYLREEEEEYTEGNRAEYFPQCIGQYISTDMMLIQLEILHMMEI